MPYENHRISATSIHEPRYISLLSKKLYQLFCQTKRRVMQVSKTRQFFSKAKDQNSVRGQRYKIQNPTLPKEEQSARIDDVRKTKRAAAERTEAATVSLEAKREAGGPE